MKKLLYLFLTLLIVACSSEDNNNDGDNNQSSCNGDNPVYLADNGVTIKACDFAIVGDTGVVNGIGYTIVDKETLRNMISNGDDVTRVCTTRIINMVYLTGPTTGGEGLLDNQNINSWDVSNVTNMEQMFYACISFNQDLSSWDVSNVTNMRSMFIYATSYNQNLSSWDVDGVIDCGGFSEGATSWTLPKPNFTNCTP